jgi:hypothetical protein
MTHPPLLLPHSAASVIQRSWRGGRGRYLATIQRKLAKLRAKEGKASTLIQKVFRGERARERVRVYVHDVLHHMYEAAAWCGTVLGGAGGGLRVEG